MKNKWTQDEIKFLIENYPSYGKEYCAKKLNRESSSIFKKASRLKLKVNSDVRLANNIKAQVKFQNERPNNDFNINIDDMQEKIRLLEDQVSNIRVAKGMRRRDG